MDESLWSQETIVPEFQTINRLSTFKLPKINRSFLYPTLEKDLKTLVQNTSEITVLPISEPLSNIEMNKLNINSELEKSVKPNSAIDTSVVSVAPTSLSRNKRSSPVTIVHLPF